MIGSAVNNDNDNSLSRVISQGSDLGEGASGQERLPNLENAEAAEGIDSVAAAAAGSAESHQIVPMMESNYVPLPADGVARLVPEGEDNINNTVEYEEGEGGVMAPLQIFADQQHLESSSTLSSIDQEVNIEDATYVKVEDNEESTPMKRKPTLHRMPSGGSSNSSKRAASSGSSRDWGWFTDDVHPSTRVNLLNENRRQARIASTSDNDLVAMAVNAPNYIFEESISTQQLWKMHAGKRPPQPAEERAFYEKMWAQNFARSQVDYKMPVEDLLSPSPMSLNPFAEGNYDTAETDYSLPPTQGNDVAEYALNRLDDHARSHVVNRKVRDGEGELIVVERGDNVFGTTVSKAFARTNEDGDTVAGVVDTVNISIACYRVVESKKHGKYAQFLVIYREGGIRDTVGVWKRYSDFEDLAHKVTQSHEGCAAAFANISPLSIAEDEPECEHLPNAITSWNLLKKRQRWYRCLDAGYLSLKVFLLERFLHDILFESSSPQLLRDFVGVDSQML